MCVLPDGHLVKRATISHTKKEPRSLLFPLKRGFFEDGAGGGNRGNMSLGMLGISD